MDAACVSAGEELDGLEAVAEVEAVPEPPTGLHARSQLSEGDEHVQIFSPLPLNESDELEIRDESEGVGGATGAGGLLQVAAGQPVVLGTLYSDEEEEGGFLDPDYNPGSDGEDEIGTDIRLAESVVIRLATEPENDSDDDSPQEAPNNLVSGLLGRIGLRAMLRGGMHRAPR